MAPAQPTTWAMTYVRSRQAINEQTMVMAPFLGLLVSEKPAIAIHDLRNMSPYQRAPRSHSITAAITITVMRCPVSITEIRAAESLTTCILESSITELISGSHAQKPQGCRFPRGPYDRSRRKHDAAWREAMSRDFRGLALKW